MILDGFARTRFKGLGVHHTIRFVRHALATAEHFGLQYRDQTAYLMFVMNFLGSWFWHDPRFPKMADILHSSTLSNHRKIEELHAAFSQFSTNFIGDDYSLYWAALARTEAKLPPLLENAASDEAVLRAQMECHGRPDVIRHFPAAAFLERSRHAADAIGMSSPQAIGHLLFSAIGSERAITMIRSSRGSRRRRGSKEPQIPVRGLCWPMR